MGLGSHEVPSAEEVSGAIGLVLVFDFVSADRAAIGDATSPQVVCGGAMTDDVSDGGGVGGGPGGRLDFSALESV